MTQDEFIFAARCLARQALAALPDEDRGRALMKLEPNEMPGTAQPAVTVVVTLSANAWSLRVAIVGPKPMRVTEVSGLLAVPEKAA
jgi:hypothetical protein